MCSGFIHVIACNRISLFFLRLQSFSLHIYTTFCLAIYPLMDCWFVSTSWLFWVMLQWTWICKYLFEILFSSLLDIYPKAELLEHVVIIFLNFLWKLHSVILSCRPFYISINSSQSSNFSISTSTFVIFVVWIVAIFLGVKWYLNMVLIWISLLISDADHLLICSLTIFLSSLEKCLF